MRKKAEHRDVKTRHRCRKSKNDTYVHTDHPPSPSVSGIVPSLIRALLISTVSLWRTLHDESYSISGAGCAEYARVLNSQARGKVIEIPPLLRKIQDYLLLFVGLCRAQRRPHRLRDQQSLLLKGYGGKYNGRRVKLTNDANTVSRLWVSGDIYPTSIPPYASWRTKGQCLLSFAPVYMKTRTRSFSCVVSTAKRDVLLRSQTLFCFFHTVRMDFTYLCSTLHQSMVSVRMSLSKESVIFVLF